MLCLVEKTEGGDREPFRGWDMIGNFREIFGHGGDSIYGGFLGESTPRSKDKKRVSLRSQYRSHVFTPVYLLSSNSKALIASRKLSEIEFQEVSILTI